MASRKRLDDMVEEGAAGNALPKAGIATCAGVAIGGLNALLSGVAFAAGSCLVDRIKRKVKRPFRAYLDDYSVGSYMGGIGSRIFDTVNMIIPGASLLPMLGRAALTIGPGNILFTTLYHVIDPMVKTGIRAYRNIIGSLRQAWRDYKKTTKWLGIPLGMTVNGYLGGYPGIIASDTAYRYIVGR